mgnify:CR=1 FL=1
MDAFYQNYLLITFRMEKNHITLLEIPEAGHTVVAPVFLPVHFAESSYPSKGIYYGYVCKPSWHKCPSAPFVNTINLCGLDSWFHAGAINKIYLAYE